MAENTEVFCQSVAAYLQAKLGIRTDYISTIPWQERERLFDEEAARQRYARAFRPRAVCRSAGLRLRPDSDYGQESGASFARLACCATPVKLGAKSAPLNNQKEESIRWQIWKGKKPRLLV